MKTVSSIILLYLVAAFLTSAAYTTNILWLFKHFSSTITLETILAVVGIIAAPLGVFHGFYLWF